MSAHLEILLSVDTAAGGEVLREARTHGHAHHTARRASPGSDSGLETTPHWPSPHRHVAEAHLCVGRADALVHQDVNAVGRDVAAMDGEAESLGEQPTALVVRMDDGGQARQREVPERNPQPLRCRLCGITMALSATVQHPPNLDLVPLRPGMKPNSPDELARGADDDGALPKATGRPDGLEASSLSSRLHSIEGLATDVPRDLLVRVNSGQRCSVLMPERRK
jgi:hypothetical protein